MIPLMRNVKYAKMFMIFLPHMLFGCKLAQYICQLCEKALFRNFRKDQIHLIDSDHQAVKAINYFTTIISYI